MKKGIYLAICLLTGLGTWAQGLHMGIKGGLNVSQFSSQASQNVSSATGFHAGFLAEVSVLGKVSIQPELLLSAQGSKVSTSIDTFNNKLYYLQLPVMVKVFVWKGLYVEAGPQAGLLLSAKAISDATGASDDIKSNFKTFDYAANVGVGYDLLKHVFANVRYSFGLQDINNMPGGDAVKNGVFQLSVGVKL